MSITTLIIINKTSLVGFSGPIRHIPPLVASPEGVDTTKWRPSKTTKWIVVYPRGIFSLLVATACVDFTDS